MLTDASVFDATLSELDELIVRASASLVTSSSALPESFPAPHAAQERVIAEADRFNVLKMGRRTGKTELLMRLLAETALQGFPTAYFGPIYPMVEDVFATLENRLYGRITRKVQGHRLELDTGGIIDFWSMSLGGDRARGRKYKRVALDEAAMVMGLLRFWDDVVRPTLIDFEGDAWFGSTPRRGSQFDELFERGQSELEWRSWKVPSWDNPHLPSGEIERAKAQMSREAFSREIAAEDEFGSSELVYPEFNRLQHVKPARVGWAECKWRVAAIDPGGGDPTALYLIGVDDREHIHVYAPEFYRRGDVTVDALAEFLSKASKVARVQRIVVGETGGNVITNTLHRLGFPAVKAEMAKGEGLEFVRWALQNNVLTVDPGCENMITEFGLYRWAQKRDPFGGDRYATSMPGDRHGDALDSLRYGIFTIIQSLRSARPVVVEAQQRVGRVQ